MAIQDVIHQIDTEIAKLQQAKVLLGGGAMTSPAIKGKRGRPKGSASTKRAVAKKTVAKKTRKPLSSEARKKIADAQKVRWAKAKKAA
jgi:hypothetical protein